MNLGEVRENRARERERKRGRLTTNLPESAMYNIPFLLFTVNLIGLLNVFLTPTVPGVGRTGVGVHRASKFLPHIPTPAVFCSFEPEEICSFFSSSYCITVSTAERAFDTISDNVRCDSKANIILPLLPLSSPLPPLLFSPFFLRHIKTVGEFFIDNAVQDSNDASNKILSGISEGINNESYEFLASKFWSKFLF